MIRLDSLYQPSEHFAKVAFAPDEESNLGKKFRLSKLEQLGEGFYNATNYGFGNAGFVITEEGVVVIDTTPSIQGAEKVLAEIRKLTEKPVKYLIYTHGHFDHVLGAPVFKRAGATIIAHRNVVERFDRYRKLNQQFIRINSLQFQRSFDEEYLKFTDYPDVVYDWEYTFELGGKTFRLIHGKGETDDATVVYIPEDRIIYAGDFVAWSFPNIGNPQKVIRYEKEWYETLERIRAFKPKSLATGHGPSLLDEQTVMECIGDITGALKFLYEECIRHINQGSSLEEMLAEIQLPENLASSRYLRQIYGSREFAIRGIFRRYTGWFDGNPSNLAPAPQQEINRTILELIGDQEKVFEKIETLQAAGNLQLAMHLADLVLSGQPDHKQAHRVKARLLQAAGMAGNNLFLRNFYLGYSSQEEALAGKTPEDETAK